MLTNATFIWLKYNETIPLRFFVSVKTIFSIIHPVISVMWSFRIIFTYWLLLNKLFLLLIVKMFVLETIMHFLQDLSWIERLKEQHLFKTDIFLHL